MKNNAFVDYMLNHPSNWAQYHKEYISQTSRDCPYHWSGSIEEIDNAIRFCSNVIQQIFDNPETKNPLAKVEGFIKLRAKSMELLTKRRVIKRMNGSSVREMKEELMKFYVR